MSSGVARPTPGPTSHDRLCHTNHVGFPPSLPIVTTCDATEWSSDGGVLCFGRALGADPQFAEQLPDGRDPRFVQHPRVEQLRQRVYQIALGYEDCNDATRLRNDRAFKVACDRLPEDEAGLSSPLETTHRPDDVDRARSRSAAT